VGVERCEFPVSTVYGWVVMGRVLWPLGDNAAFTGYTFCVRGGLHHCFGVLLAAWCTYGGHRGGVNCWSCLLLHFVQLGGVGCLAVGWYMSVSLTAFAGK